MTNSDSTLSEAELDLELTDEHLENVSGSMHVRKSGGDPLDVIKSGDSEDGGNVVARQFP